MPGRFRHGRRRRAGLPPAGERERHLVEGGRFTDYRSSFEGPYTPGTRSPAWRINTVICPR